MWNLSLLMTLLVIVIPHPLLVVWKPAPIMQVDVTSDTRIDAPTAGQVIQGNYLILGNTNSDRFQNYEVNFAYKDDPTHTWFLVQEGSSPIQDGVLAVWDTTTITDGEYTLRLLVTLNDGTELETVVDQIRVRNYSPIETDTPTPIPPLVTLVPAVASGSPTPRYTLEATLTPQPMTPTPLPTNPAIITSLQMEETLGKGAAISLGMLALLGAYLGLRSIFHKHV
jgi:hypothetical protein